MWMIMRKFDRLWSIDVIPMQWKLRTHYSTFLGESSSHWWILSTKASKAAFGCCLCWQPEQAFEYCISDFTWHLCNGMAMMTWLTNITTDIKSMGHYKINRDYLKQLTGTICILWKRGLTLTSHWPHIKCRLGTGHYFFILYVFNFFITLSKTSLVAGGRWS